jgi:alkaline phosphatase D
MFEGAGLTPLFTPEIEAALPRGVSFLIMGKSAIYSSTGSRTQVIKDTFDLYAAKRYLETGGAAQEVYGAQQNTWLQGTLLSSPAKWKVLEHSFMMTPMVIDFTNPLIAALLPEGFPDFLRTKLIVNNEDFNGLPQKTQEVLGLLDLIDNAVVISGDIHATFVTNHQNGVYEITPPAISSATNGELVARAIASDPILGQIPGIDQIVAQYALLLQVSSLSPEVSPSTILYDNTFSHGFGVIDVTPELMRVWIEEMPSSEVANSYYDDPEALNGLFSTSVFTIEDGAIRPGP